MFKELAKFLRDFLAFLKPIHNCPYCVPPEEAFYDAKCGHGKQWVKLMKRAEELNNKLNKLN